LDPSCQIAQDNERKPVPVTARKQLSAVQVEIARFSKPLAAARPTRTMRAYQESSILRGKKRELSEEEGGQEGGLPPSSGSWRAQKQKIPPADPLAQRSRTWVCGRVYVRTELCGVRTRQWMWRAWLVKALSNKLTRDLT
jgi:hypothetical protein